MIDLPYQNFHYQNSFTLKEKKKTAHIFMQWAEKSVLTSRVKGNQDILLSESWRKSPKFKVSLHAQLKKRKVYNGKCMFVSVSIYKKRPFMISCIFICTLKLNYKNIGR